MASRFTLPMRLLAFTTLRSWSYRAKCAAGSVLRLSFLPTAVEVGCTSGMRLQNCCFLPSPDINTGGVFPIDAVTIMTNRYCVSLLQQLEPVYF